LRGSQGSSWEFREGESYTFTNLLVSKPTSERFAFLNQEFELHSSASTDVVKCNPGSELLAPVGVDFAFAELEEIPKNSPVTLVVAVGRREDAGGYVADDSQEETMLLKWYGLPSTADLPAPGTVVRHDADNDVLVFKGESFFAPVLAKKDSERAVAVKKWRALL
jgi:hypothetical protein